MTNLRSATAIAVAGVLACAGCSKDEKDTESAQPSATEGAEEMGNPPAEYEGAPPAAVENEPDEQTGAKAAAELNDGEIARITEVVNTGEVQQGELARSRAQNPNVQLFAAQMIAEHSKAKQDGAKLVTQARLVPEESALATELADGAQGTLQSLQTGDTASFDQRYMDAQVQQHQEVLDLLDKQLIPSAQNPELKAELEKARAMVQHHLDKAKQIQAALGSATMD